MTDLQQLRNDELARLAYEMGMFDAPSTTPAAPPGRVERYEIGPGAPNPANVEAAAKRDAELKQMEFWGGRKLSPTEAGQQFSKGVPLIGPWLDEASAAIDATFNSPKDHLTGGWKDRYQQGVNYYRGRDRAVEDAAGINAKGMQFLGTGVGTIAELPLMGLSRVASGVQGLSGLGARALAGATEGGGAGFVQGSGEGTGALNDPSRMEKGRDLALLGALGGAVLPTAIEGGQNVWNMTGQRAVNAIAPRVAIGEAPSVAQGLQAATRTSLPPNVGQSTNRLVDAMAAIDASPKASVAPADANAAYDRLYRALKRQDMTPEAATELAKDLGTFGMIADTGEPVRDLGRAVMNTPSKGASLGKESLDLRQRGVLEDGEFAVRPASGRIADEAASGLGVGGKQYQGELDTLKTSQKASADPLYAKMRTGSPPVPVKDLAEFQLSPDFDRAYARARAISQRDPVKQTDGTETVLPLPEKLPGVLDWRTLDLMKQGLDDLVREGKSAGIGASEQASIKGYRSRFLSKLDTLNKDYKPARDAFAGPAAMMDAQEAGRAFMKEDAPVLAGALAKLNDSEQQAYRLGAAQALRDKLGNKPTTYDAARDLLVPNQLLRFKELFPDKESFAKFANMLDNEQTMFATRAAMVGNSSTAKQIAALQDAGDDPLASLAASVAHAKVSPITATVSFLKNALAGQKMNEGTADALAAIIFNMDKRTYPAVLEGLTAAEKRKLTAEILRQAAASGGAQGAINLDQGKP